MEDFAPKPDEPEPKGKVNPSAVGANLDDPPIHIRPIYSAISGCKAKEPFSSGHYGRWRVAPLPHRRNGIFCRKCQESGDKGTNAPAFDARAALDAILGVDLTQIHGLGPYLALKLVGECGTSLTAWPNAKHFTSWLGLAPDNKISGGKVLSSKTWRTSNRAPSLLRLAAMSF